METYIVKYETLVMGETKTLYHENIKPNKNKQTMNVYNEHLTSDEKKARVFYKESEAHGVCNLFSNNFSIGEVITIPF